MAIRDIRGGMLARCMVAVVTLSTAALANRVGADDRPDPPVVLDDKAALPPGCESLGEIFEERFMAMSPNPERAQADAVKTAGKKGATHLVTASLEHCGPYSYCYTGVAYRCPKPGATPAGQ
jgi:hypothetical protein